MRWKWSCGRTPSRSARKRLSQLRMMGAIWDLILQQLEAELDMIELETDGAQAGGEECVPVNEFSARRCNSDRNAGTFERVTLVSLWIKRSLVERLNDSFAGNPLNRASEKRTDIRLDRIETKGSRLRWCYRCGGWSRFCSSRISRASHLNLGLLRRPIFVDSFLRVPKRPVFSLGSGRRSGGICTRRVRRERSGKNAGPLGRD